MTLKQAKATAREWNCSLTKRDGEYRVNFLGGSEATAYYTDDLGDAVGTVVQMYLDAQKRSTVGLDHIDQAELFYNVQ